MRLQPEPNSRFNYAATTCGFHRMHSFFHSSQHFSYKHTTSLSSLAVSILQGENESLSFSTRSLSSSGAAGCILLFVSRVQKTGLGPQWGREGGRRRLTLFSSLLFRAHFLFPRAARSHYKIKMCVAHPECVCVSLCLSVVHACAHFGDFHVLRECEVRAHIHAIHQIHQISAVLWTKRNCGFTAN
jgi:hypothetical protein